MSVIAIQTELHRVTRMFFDCCNAAADQADQRRIEVAIEHSIAIAEPEDDDPGDVGHHRGIEHRRAVIRTDYRAAVAHPLEPGHWLPIAVMARVSFQ
jgi:hypothetical protein